MRDFILPECKRNPSLNLRKASHFTAKWGLSNGGGFTNRQPFRPAPFRSCLQFLVLAGSWETREGGIEDGGGCHIPVTSKIHAQREYNGQDLSKTGNDFGEDLESRGGGKSRVGLQKVQGRMPMGQDRVGSAAPREWQRLCRGLVGSEGGDVVFQGQAHSSTERPRDKLTLHNVWLVIYAKYDLQPQATLL